MKLSERILNKGQLVDDNETETGIYGMTEGEHYELEQLEAENTTLKREILNADEVSRLMGILDRYQERGPSDLATYDTMLWRKLERLHSLLTAEDDPLASPDATWEELGLGFIEDPPPLESDCDET